VDANDDKLMNLPSFLEAFASIITQLSQVELQQCWSLDNIDSCFGYRNQSNACKVFL